jgi:hypothetical protein
MSGRHKFKFYYNYQKKKKNAIDPFANNIFGPQR